MPDWVVWVALGVSLVAAIAAMVRFVVVSLRAWRDVNRSRRALFGELDGLAARAEALGEKAAGLEEASARLTRTLERLAVSRRKLAVLQSAFDEATDAFAAVTAVYPRK
ncbi:MAG: hypothetical protein E6G08_01375 [Actinobacteria bacterium]|nr:MAG: hypothetical protein E6G08_01375 [Actinomycetota bacterium]